MHGTDVLFVLPSKEYGIRSDNGQNGGGYWMGIEPADVQMVENPRLSKRC